MTIGRSIKVSFHIPIFTAERWFHPMKIPSPPVLNGEIKLGRWCEGSVCLNSGSHMYEIQLNNTTALLVASFLSKHSLIIILCCKHDILSVNDGHSLRFHLVGLNLNQQVTTITTIKNYRFILDRHLDFQSAIWSAFFWSLTWMSSKYALFNPWVWQKMHPLWSTSMR